LLVHDIGPHEPKFVASRLANWGDDAATALRIAEAAAVDRCYGGRGTIYSTADALKTIMIIVGARPQFVKAAPLLRALEGAAGVHTVLVHTGQHADADMSDIFFSELAIAAPVVNLGVAGGGHADMTGRMLIALEPVLIAAKPDAVVVFGDTNSTLAGTLTAAKLGIPVAHVEAGLRSGDRRMPEEINRIVVDHLSRWLFCPTRAAVGNLQDEGLVTGVALTGDVMCDALQQAMPRSRQRSRSLGTLGLAAGTYAVATIHRAGTTDDPAQLKAAFAYLADRARLRPVVMPLHPRTARVVAEQGIPTDALRIIGPLGYLDMIALMDGAVEILTDSGGLQKEAYFLRKPCVTLRAETEWVETIAAGWNRLWTTPDYLPRREIDDYGHGHASEIICNLLLADLR
jgi:UDP-GlcNAc3NAcA epimerase